MAGSHWNTRWAGTSLKIQKRVFYSITLTGGTGNFRISAYKDEAADYGPQCIAYELKENTSSALVKVGKWDCAYSAETFQEEGAWYTTHIWVTGEGDLSFECSFTVSKGGDKHPAEEGVSHPREIIPIRVLEIGEVNTAFEWASTTIKSNSPRISLRRRAILTVYSK